MENQLLYNLSQWHCEPFICQYYIFKNILPAQIPLLLEQVAENMAQDNTTIAESTIWAGANYYKEWQKSVEKTFDDDCWPSAWLNRNSKQSFISGIVLAIGGTNVKTLVTNEFILKITNAPFGQFVLTGTNIATKRDRSNIYKTMNESIAKSLNFCDLTNQDIVFSKLIICSSLPDQTAQVPDMQKFVPTIISPENPLQSLNSQVVKPEGEFTRMITELEQGFVVSIYKGDQPIVVNKVNYFDANTYNIIESDDFTQNIFINGQNNKPVKLISGLIYSVDERFTELIKSFCKKNKLPVSSILIIEEPFLNTMAKSWFILQFAGNTPTD